MLIEEFRSVYYLPSDEIYWIPTVALDDIVKSVKEGININTHAGLEDSQCYSRLVYNIKISYITDAGRIHLDHYSSNNSFGIIPVLSHTQVYTVH